MQSYNHESNTYFTYTYSCRHKPSSILDGQMERRIVCVQMYGCMGGEMTAGWADKARKKSSSGN